MFEKIAIAAAAVAALFLVGGLLVTLLHSWMRRRTALALEAAGGELGLARILAGEGREATASYEGVVEGVPVRIRADWRLVHAIGTPFVGYASEVGITASLPCPLPFRLEVRRHAVGLPRTLTLFEREFDRDCAIVTDDPESTRDLLSAPRLRSDLRSFVRSWRRVSRVSGQLVATKIFDAHTKGAAAVTAAARQAVALARELSDGGNPDSAARGWKQQVVSERTKRIPNLVSILEPDRIRVERMTNAVRGALHEASFRPSWATIPVSAEPEMLRAAEVLAAGGALFGGAPHGWPPAAVLLEARERGLFRGPSRRCVSAVRVCPSSSGIDRVRVELAETAASARAYVRAGEKFIMKTRSVKEVVPAIETREGAGFLVHRAFPSPSLDHFDPFLLLDEMGPSDLGPGEAKGAPDHPHRGFETVTYMLSGAMEHADSQGNRGKLRPGDVQWMTAGSGVVHSEMPEESFAKKGGRMHGFQLWVNLPRRDKMMRPRYQEVHGSGIPTAASEDGKVRARVIAGEALGARAVIDTRTPILYLDVDLEPGASFTQPIPAEYNAFAYVVEGAGDFGDERRRARRHEMVRFARDGEAVRIAAPSDSRLKTLVIGGVPLNEPVARYGPFVMNTREEILQAFADYQSGKLGEIA